MSKYAPLADWLARSSDAAISLTFEQIEGIVGMLPPSAKTYQAYWSSSVIVLPLAQRGWRASVRLREGRVQFTSESVPAADAKATVQRESSRLAPDPASLPSPDLVLIGCVKSKLPGRHRARDLYTSTLFHGRMSRADATGAPWFVLSALYGLVAPDDEIESYDVELASLNAYRREEWARKVLAQIDRSFGPVSGKRIEIHAGQEYRTWVVAELKGRGAEVTVPLEGVQFGHQLAWFAQFSSSLGRPPVATPISVPTTGNGSTPPPSPFVRADPADIARTLTHDFVNGSLDLSLRLGAPAPGWAALPEFNCVRDLRASGASDTDIRLFTTFVAAMDRAREADHLWRSGLKLFHSDCGVSQRHGQDSAAWRLIGEALVDDASPAAVRNVIFEGNGDAEELLAAVRQRNDLNQPWFPLLSGPKISAMWIRMLAFPGGAAITNLKVVPVAVDVQVRKVTEYLGVTDTGSFDLESVRNQIQDAWAAVAVHSEGPPALANTCSALDPALWFFAKWGCTRCERAKQRMPISSLCASCRFPARA